MAERIETPKMGEILRKECMEQSSNLKAIYEKHYHKPLSQITAEDVGDCEELDWGQDVGAERLLIA